MSFLTSENIDKWCPTSAAFIRSVLDGGVDDIGVIQLAGQHGTMKADMCGLIAAAAELGHVSSYPLSFFSAAMTQRLSAVSAPPLVSQRRLIRVVVDRYDSAMLKAVITGSGSNLLVVDTEHELPVNYGVPCRTAPLSVEQAHKAIRESFVSKRLDKAAREVIHDAACGLQDRIKDYCSLFMASKRSDIMQVVKGAQNSACESLYETITNSDIPLDSALTAVGNTVTTVGWQEVARTMEELICKEFRSGTAELVNSHLEDLLLLRWDTQSRTLASCITIAKRTRGGS